MSLSVAIVADDLTGALDTGAPFVAQGFRVCVAVTPDGIAGAAASEPDVLVVNTASRAMPAAAAEAIVTTVGRAVARLTPGCVLKKIDSRLKGNVGAETRALAAALASSGILVAPAVPDQGRVTRGGLVIGAGLDVPLPIAPLFAGLAGTEIADAESADDLDAVVARAGPRTLLVGARGLGAALARRLSGRTEPGRVFKPSRATLFAFGSRDPITRAQIDFLASSVPGVTVIDAPDGAVGLPLSCRLPAVLRCTGEATESGDAVAARFAEVAVAAVEQLRPEALVLGGGDTALAVLSRLGIEVVEPCGEAAAGVPWFIPPASMGRSVRCLVKSGGFGSVEVLAGLIDPGHLQVRAG